MFMWTFINGDLWPAKSKHAVLLSYGHCCDMLNRHFRAISLGTALYFPVRLYRTRLMASHSSGVRTRSERNHHVIWIIPPI